MRVTVAVLFRLQPREAVKPHGSVRPARNNRVTPAMAAGLSDRSATFEDLVALIDERAPEVQYARTYKKRIKGGS